MDRVVLGKNAQGTESGFWVSKPGVNALAMTEPMGTLEDDWYGYQEEFDWDGTAEPSWASASSNDASKSGFYLATGGAAWPTYNADRLIRSANGTLLVAGYRGTRGDGISFGSTLHTKALRESQTGDPTSEAFVGERYPVIEMKIRLVPPLEIDGEPNPDLPQHSGADFNVYFENRPIENSGIQAGKLWDTFMYRGHAYEYTGMETGSSDTEDRRYLSANNLYFNGDRNLTLGRWTDIFKDEPEIGSSANDWKIVEWDMRTMAYGPQVTTHSNQTTNPTHNGNPAIPKPYLETNPFGLGAENALVYNPWTAPADYMWAWEQHYFNNHPGTYSLGGVATSLATSAPYNPHPQNSEYRITHLQLTLNYYAYTGNVTHESKPPMWEIDYVRVKKPNIPKDSGPYGHRKDSMLFSSDWDHTGLVHQTGTVVIGTQKGNIDGSTSANLFSDTVKETSNGVVHFDPLPYIPLVIFQRIDPNGVVSYPGGEKEFSIAATEWEDHTYPKTNIGGRNISQTGYDLRVYWNPSVFAMESGYPEWRGRWPYMDHTSFGMGAGLTGVATGLIYDATLQRYNVVPHGGLWGSKGWYGKGRSGATAFSYFTHYSDSNLNRFGHISSDYHHSPLFQYIDPDASLSESAVRVGLSIMNYPLGSNPSMRYANTGARDVENNRIVGFQAPYLGSFGTPTGNEQTITQDLIDKGQFPADTGWQDLTVPQQSKPANGTRDLGPYTMDRLPWKTNIPGNDPSADAGETTYTAIKGNGFGPSKRAGNNFANQVSTFYEARTFAYVRAGRDHFNLTCRNAIGNDGLEPVLNLAPSLPEETSSLSTYSIGSGSTGGSANQGSAAYGNFYERLGSLWDSFPRNQGGMAFRNDNGNWGMFHPVFTLYDGQPFSEGLSLRANTVTTANSLFLDKTGTLPAIDGLDSRLKAIDGQARSGSHQNGYLSSIYQSEIATLDATTQHIPESTFDQYKWHPSFCCHPLIFDGNLARPTDDAPTYQANDVFAATQGEVGFPQFNPENGMYAGSTGGFYPYRYHREEKSAMGMVSFGDWGTSAFNAYEQYYWYEYEIKRLSSPGITHPAGIVPATDDAFNNRNGITWKPDPGENYWTDVVANDSGSARVLNQTAYIGGARNKKRNPQLVSGAVLIPSSGLGGIVFPQPAYVEYNEADANPPIYKYWVLRVPVSIDAYTSVDPEFF